MSEFFLHSFNVLSHGLVGYIVPFLFVLTIVVFFHELGHFLVARWAGVKVLTFSLGFGPELAGFNDRHGKIRFGAIARLVEATLEAWIRSGNLAPLTSADDAIAVDYDARNKAVTLLPQIALKAS